MQQLAFLFSCPKLHGIERNSLLTPQLSKFLSHPFIAVKKMPYRYCTLRDRKNS